MTVNAALLSDRARGINVSGIRRVFELGAKLPDPINLSIGQPDFEVPPAMRRAAAEAMDARQNGYTLTHGTAALRERVAEHLAWDIGWRVGDGGPSVAITSGTSGALLTAFLSLIGPGDEAIIPDPYFVMYPVLGQLTHGKCVPCDTYPDFRMTAERVEPLINDRTKLVLLNSPGNPTGVVMSTKEVRDLLDLCRSKGVVLISDEIYDEFTFSGGRTEPAIGDASSLRCPSPCRVDGSADDILLIRGFGKTYGVTGWRLGYAAGPSWLIDAMNRIQQYTFVCPPAPLQAGAIESFGVDMRPQVDEYERRRNEVAGALSELTEVATPEGAFYAFVRVPESIGMTGSQLTEALVERNVLVIPGGVFSGRDTHIRLSFSAPPAKLSEGVSIIADLMKR
ncbi:MAG: aspartate aminotransferase [Phycisphaerae bacterium]|nr:aspartate aminotransferase [Phycisphaerae bacterium]